MKIEVKMKAKNPINPNFDDFSSFCHSLCCGFFYPLNPTATFIATSRPNTGDSL
jgi:hypothetical protein